MDHLYTIRYYTSHITIPHSLLVSTIRFLVTASNSRDSSALALTSLPIGSQLHRLNLIFTYSLTTDYSSVGVLVIWLLGTDRIGNTVSKNSPIVVRELVAVGTSLFRGRYLVRGPNATIFILREFNYESGNSMLLRKVGHHLPHYTASQPIRLQYSLSKTSVTLHHDTATLIVILSPESYHTLTCRRRVWIHGVFPFVWLPTQ
jgi:hypothetical protein